MTYADFIAGKKRAHRGSGIKVDVTHPALFDFQQSVVKWALRKGSACVFAGTGLGKTIIIGVELKKSYANQARKNLANANAQSNMDELL